jgi:hypothetical protein
VGIASGFDPYSHQVVQAIIALYEHPANRQLKPVVSSSMIKTPLTGVDRSSCFTLCFPELAAQAQLSCNINVPSNGISATLRFRNGNILIPGPLYCPKSYTVQYFERPGSGKVQREETTHFDVPGSGLYFEADEVARCVRGGKLESAVWGHDKTILEMEIFDEVNVVVRYHSAFLIVTNRSAAKVGIGSLGRLNKLEEEFEAKHLSLEKLDMTRSFTISPEHIYLQCQVAGQ